MPFMSLCPDKAQGYKVKVQSEISESFLIPAHHDDWLTGLWDSLCIGGTWNVSTIVCVYGTSEGAIVDVRDKRVHLCVCWSGCKSISKTICPNYIYYPIFDLVKIRFSCCRLYYSIFRAEYGSPSGDKLQSVLEAKVAAYNESCGSTCAAVQLDADGRVIVAICTPLMKRVHSMWQYSAEMMFIDSSGGMDRQNYRVFLLLAHSPAGALPLGVIILPSEAQDTITAGLKLYNGLLPADAYFGRSSAQGPEVCMSDDCSSLRAALHCVYPSSTLLLCAFHLLQAMWRWLWDGRHGVMKEDRPVLLGLVRCMLYAESVEDLERRYTTAKENPTGQRYPEYLVHLASVYDRKEVWALCYRAAAPTRGNNTNNFCEAAMRILKDRILCRLKAFNLNQLLDFMLTRLEHYYERRLVDVANNRVRAALQSRFYPKEKDIDCQSIVKVAWLTQ